MSDHSKSGALNEELMQRIAEHTELSDTGRASSRLKSKVYSALLRTQVDETPLMSLAQSKSRGQTLCIFEELVQIAPIGERAKSVNICRTCHARALAERMENPPIYWGGCPYVGFKNS